MPLPRSSFSALRPPTPSRAVLWKGQVSYYTLEVDGQKNVDAAWF
ncbi:DUF427 domain-containing protein [Rhizobium sp. VS19-DR104.2]|nr:MULTISPECIES: DUF427 domain-containing protein [unclassified Rhizobium]MBZ5761998.1 DUF427 domain-containing protein [Rhizobium sp. VS19-DR96]MBZ5768356.1 DUF427 domain-containing protein [Rhizobium sp. VS19-DR129.2]MBZ5775626.1 DUF427 domain-containing protein [Rhizobium sp. VS19-DRK62.2]MBZ5786876.1 DUF427 domain-containing protein [Rhizobium sp. VS19-DR121]MBZ5804446.1 DUF427 domain-containing protein [Rhizobium sp. VS19-DR181]